MIKYLIEPNTNVNFNNIINIIINLINEINLELSLNKNIILENIYLINVNIVISITSKYLKKYIFFPNIKLLNIQILNKYLDVVMYCNFNIQKTEFTVNFSKWINFFLGTLKIESIIFNELSLQQKENLRQSIVNGDFYMIDNLIFSYNNIQTYGAILKQKYLEFKSNSNYKYNNYHNEKTKNIMDSCLFDNFIVTIYYQ